MLTIHQRSFPVIQMHVRTLCVHKSNRLGIVCRCFVASTTNAICISFITNSIFCTWSYCQIESIGRLFCRQQDSVRHQRWCGMQYISFWSLSASHIFMVSSLVLKWHMHYCHCQSIFGTSEDISRTTALWTALNHLTTLYWVNSSMRHARLWQPNTLYTSEFE